MSIRDNKQNKEFRFDLKSLEMVKPADLVGKTITVNDCEFIKCKDGEERLALVTADGKFFFAPTVFENVFKSAAADGDDYLELRAGMKLTVKLSETKGGQKYYDFDWVD